MIHIAKPLIGDEEIKAVEEVLRSGMLAQGKKVAEFEDKFSQFIGSKHSVAVGNGTQALHAALVACGIKPGDEVITSGFTFIASATSIVHSGATPVFADIEPKTFNIDIDSVKKLISEKTKAIMPVHLFGLGVDIHAFKELCAEKDLILIEDACQSHGARINGKGVGTFGQAAAFSFYPTKNMTTGEGGAVTTQDEKIDEDLRYLRHQGQKSRYEYAMVGYNYRMTDIAAAIGIAQLDKLPGWTEKRIANAAFFNKEFSAAGIQIPYVPDGYKHVYHQYTLRVQNRNSVIKKLADMGVGSGVYYPMGLHELGPMAGFRKEPLPEVEKASQEVLSLPVHPGLSNEELATVAEAVVKAVN
ncbi:MAG: DegT/DnrJ/EryC1/StrS family aminotransferase [Thermoplasmata archaeon]|nr:DegT/DnrJ/EryC1/StrS family aminotransferase [Thermoplasmata archaeon]